VNRRLKEAFTLIELIIVIVIISMVTFLVFSENVNRTKKEDRLTPLNLKSSILKSVKPSSDITFFCINGCKRCYILQDNKITPFKGNINLGTNLEVYIVDSSGRLTQLTSEDFGTINDHKICFKFKIYKNKSSTKYILSNDQGVYFLPSYFGKPKELKDIDSGVSLWLREEFDLRDEANIY
jgi:prepilin-type N-terminal cleavage/methylation domain-containing protein